MWRPSSVGLNTKSRAPGIDMPRLGRLASSALRALPQRRVRPSIWSAPSGRSAKADAADAPEPTQLKRTAVSRAVRRYAILRVPVFLVAAVRRPARAENAAREAGTRRTVNSGAPTPTGGRQVPPVSQTWSEVRNRETRYVVQRNKLSKEVSYGPRNDPPEPCAHFERRC